MAYEDRKQQRLMAEYRWHETEYKRQVELDFPFARMLNNFGSESFLEVMGRYDTNEKIKRLLALNKVTYTEQRLLLDDPLTDEERSLGVATKNEIFAVSGPKLAEYQSRPGDGLKLLKKPRLVTALVGAVTPILGPAKMGQSKDDFAFVTPIDGWYLRTYMYVNSMLSLVVVARHLILRWPDEAMPLTDTSQILDCQWRGWYVQYVEDLEATLISVTEVLKYCLDAAPNIVSQITDYTPYPYPHNDKYLSD